MRQQESALHTVMSPNAPQRTDAEIAMANIPVSALLQSTLLPLVRTQLSQPPTQQQVLLRLHLSQPLSHHS